MSLLTLHSYEKNNTNIVIQLQQVQWIFFHFETLPVGEL